MRWGFGFSGGVVFRFVVVGSVGRLVSVSSVLIWLVIRGICIRRLRSHGCLYCVGGRYSNEDFNNLTFLLD